jgi:hypothetical protein
MSNKNLYIMRILFLLLFFGWVHAQEPTLTPSGFEPVVVEMPELTAEALFHKTEQWVQYFYKNPSEVLKARIGNELIRIEGFCNDCWSTKTLGIKYPMDFSYVLEFGFKDGKYRFDLKVRELSNDGARMLFHTDTFFKKDGSVKTAYVMAVDEMNENVSRIFESHQNFVLGKTMEQKSDW